MSVNPSPFGPKPQLELASGAPAVGNQLFFYVAGSVNTKQTTYTDSTGATPNPNPIILNSLGQPANEIWFTAGQAYKVVFAPAGDTDPPSSPVWTIDNLRGINDSSISIDQWVQSGVTPTYVSASQFTVPGDQTSAFQVGRRVKATVTAGTVYGTIGASAYTALTTVTVIFENSGALDAGLSAVSYGIVTDTNDSLPRGTSRGKEIDVATNATANIFAAGSENIRLTGTTTVTAFDTANAGIIRRCRAQSAFTLTYNASSMILPGAANIYVAAGDTFEAVSLGSGNTLVFSYTKSSGFPVTAYPQIQPLPTPILAGNALTIPSASFTLDFRNTSLGTGGTPTTLSGSIAALTIPSGATLGGVNAVAQEVIVLALNNAGTMEYAVVNLAGGNDLTETGVISTTAISGTSNSANVIYSNTARTNVAYRIIGAFVSTQATAGTWVTAPSLVQGYGGQALAAMSSLGYGQNWQDLTASRALNTTYYNTTGKPIMIDIYTTSTSSGQAIIITINGVAVKGGGSASTNPMGLTAIVPTGASYLATNTNQTLSYWSELR